MIANKGSDDKAVLIERISLAYINIYLDFNGLSLMINFLRLHSKSLGFLSLGALHLFHGVSIS